MAGLSNIEWTDATWNPISGCLMISPGCTNCYAMRMAARLQAIHHRAYRKVTRKSSGRPVWTGKIHLNESALEIPRRWRKPRRVFVNSMSDLFQDGVPASFVTRIWEVMSATPQHSYQVLTKRPEHMAAIFLSERLPILPNVWLGTSVEADRYTSRIEALRQIPASVRFVSFEPLLASVGKLDLRGVHWAIVGGESGPGARPMTEEWVEEIQRQCSAEGVAFFFKQWGGRNKKQTGRSYLGRTWDEFPQAGLAL